MEKIHGSSAHVGYRAALGSSPETLIFFAGGCSHELFKALFDEQALLEKFRKLGQPEVVVFGEVYGGRMQGMSATYGKNLKFITFDVKVGESWLNVPAMNDVATGLGLEVVHFVKCEATVADLDAQRDLPSVQAVRNGVVEPRPREGIRADSADAHVRTGEACRKT